MFRNQEFRNFSTRLKMMMKIKMISHLPMKLQEPYLIFQKYTSKTPHKAFELKSTIQDNLFTTIQDMKEFKNY